MASNRPTPKPRRSKLIEFHDQTMIQPLIQFSDDENEDLYFTRSIASISSVRNEKSTRHSENSLGSASSAYETRNAVDQLDDAHTLLDLERKQKQAKVLAHQKELEAKLAQTQLELESIDLQIKHKKLRARANILESYCVDERDEISQAMDSRSIASVETQYIKPTPRPRAANRQFEHAIDDSGQVQITPPKSAMIPGQSLNQFSDIRLLAESLKSCMKSVHTNIPEPFTFLGDPLIYPRWESSVNTYINSLDIIEHDKIHFLLKYVGGEVLESVGHLHLSNSSDAYSRAKKVIKERFGSSFVVAEAFVMKLQTFPVIKKGNNSGLRSFADLLSQAEAAMPTIDDLDCLNTTHMNIMLAAKLPYWLSDKWKTTIVDYRTTHDGRFPPFTKFVSLVQYHANVQNDPVVANMERYQNRTGFANTGNNSQQRSKVSHTFLSSGSKVEKQCAVCNLSNHNLSTCREFSKWDSYRQNDYIYQNKLCYSCLEKDHFSGQCREPTSCFKCKGKHPTSRHNHYYRAPNAKSRFQDNQQPNQGQEPKSSTGDLVTMPSCSNPVNSNTAAPDYQKPSSDPSQDVQTTCHAISKSRPGLTSLILPIWLSCVDNPKREILTYALLDNMSNTTLVTNDLCEKLQLETSEFVNLKVKTVNNPSPSAQTCAVYNNLQIRGFNAYEILPLTNVSCANAIPMDRSNIPTPSTAATWDHLKEIAHEIPDIQSCSIGMLIGYDNSQAIVPTKILAGPNQTDPFGWKTALGWGVIGRKQENPKIMRHTNAYSSSADIESVTFACLSKPVKPHNITPVQALELLQQDFSENQTTQTGPTLSQNDLQFLSILGKGIEQNQDGNYEMPLPFLERPNMPNNRDMAEKRLCSLKTKLLKNQQLKADYLKFMSEIITSGDAEVVSESYPEHNTEKWYIPHFAVYHPKKPDKIRVVFDCSAKYKGVSLNDYLLQGPDLMNRLVGILHRFRKGKIGIMCDIQKMFHMFKVAPSDRDYLRFLWFEDEKLEKIVEYRMTVHLFGATSSPGCATYGLRHLAYKHHDANNPLSVIAKDFIENDFYVDDGLISLDSTADAVSIVNNAVDICREGKVRLHKFMSNNKDVLAAIPNSEMSETVKDLDLQSCDSVLPAERALGVKWCADSDTFRFTVKSKHAEKTPTKRTVLSTVASVFDPLGFLSPFILSGKRILQDICKDGKDWDDSLDSVMEEKWLAWESELESLDQVVISRCLYPNNFGKVVRTELHHFSDASKIGYGQSSYLRVTNSKGEVHVCLLASKSRVLPINKSVTIPRAELQAAVLSCKLAEALRADLKLDKIDQEVFWCDSKVVLGYIKNREKRFHVYVSNRVQQIHDLSMLTQWFYIPSESNPADIASRGAPINNLTNSMWFDGPKFLWNPDISDMMQPIDYKISHEDPEVVVTTHAVHTENKFSIDHRLERFSSLKSAIRGVSLLQDKLRGMKNLNRPIDLQVRRKTALTHIIRSTQQEMFHDDYNQILNGTHRKQSSLDHLNPFIDDEGVIRVGGRLENSDMTFEERHPIILPKEAKLSRLVIEHCHVSVAHQGRGITLAEVRSTGYWIIGLSKQVANTIKSCVTCRKTRGATAEQLMSSLPKERTIPTPPFTYIGSDCFGPFTLKEGRKEIKRYGVVFTCLASRGIHIEVLDDMTTDCMINALRCLISIRGPIRKLMSDQGTNFIGAANEFAKAGTFADDNNFEWETTTPSSSHMGGVWERQIRTIRSILNSMLKIHSPRLDSSSLRTFLYEVMAIVNCRPLTTISESDCQPLSPNLLLTMKSKVVLPPPGNFDETDVYSRKRWKVVQGLANQFWSKWRNMYLNNLQSRQKWTQKSDNLQIGDIVLVKDINLHRRQWPIAMITEVNPSKDGQVRKVTVKLSDAAKVNSKGKQTSPFSCLDRPIHKLVFLCRPKIQ